MYGLNAFALIVFAVVNVTAFQLFQCSEVIRTKAVRGLCWILLLINVCRYTLSPLLGHGVIIPVEFSTVAYFVVPIIVLTARKKLLIWAAYSGLIAGFCYYMAMMIAGGAIYDSYPHETIYISMFCHGTLYLCGLVLTGTQRYSEKDRYLIFGGIVYVAVQAIAFRSLMAGTERMFIYELLDGVYLKQLLSRDNWHTASLAYYVILACVILLTVKCFFKLNHAIFGKTSSSREQFSMSTLTILSKR